MKPPHSPASHGGRDDVGEPEDHLGSALTSCRLGRRAQQIWCQGDADVKARTSHERPSRRYFFQASYSDATWHTVVGKATSTCESLGRGTCASMRQHAPGSGKTEVILMLAHP